MKSIRDVLDHIELRLSQAIDTDRPWLYALSPTHYEQYLGELEGVREFVLSDDSPDDETYGYGRFLECTKDVGSLSYALKRMQCDGVHDSGQLFDELRGVWREYLASPFRRPRPVDMAVD